MKTSTLLLLAAGVLPVYGQAPAAVTMPDAEVAMLLAPPSCGKADLMNRAAVLPAAALLPADVDSFLVLTNVGDTLLRLAGKNAAPELAAVSGIESIALGVSADGVQMLKTVSDSVGTAGLTDGVSGLGAKWVSRASESVAPVIRAELETLTAQAKQQAEAAFDKVAVKPVYLAVTVKPEAVSTMQLMVGLAVGQLSGGDLRGIVEVNGFKGVCISEQCPIQKPNGKPMDAWLMYRMQGNSLLLVLCGDPSEAKAPASPAESVLAEAELQDSRINKKTVVVTSASPGFVNMMADMPSSPEVMAAFAGGVFRKLASSDPAFKTSGVDAVNGIDYLMQQFRKLSVAVTSPSQCYVWADDDVHMELVQDACGAEYAPATMKQPVQLTNPDVAFYLESAPNTGGPSVDLSGMMGVAGTIANAVVQTFGEPYRSKRQAEVNRAMSYVPEIQALEKIATTISVGLTGSSTVVVTVPAATRSVEAAWYSPVRNRAALESAGQQIQTLVEHLQTRFGSTRKCNLSAPVAQGDVTTYTLEVPADCQCPLAGSEPGVMVSSADFAVGTTAALNRYLMASATGTMPLPGCVVQLRMEPVSRIFERIAADSERNGKHEEARDTLEAAQMLRSASEYVERVTGGIIIKDNRVHTRVDVILNK